VVIAKFYFRKASSISDDRSAGFYRRDRHGAGAAGRRVPKLRRTADVPQKPSAVHRQLRFRELSFTCRECAAPLAGIVDRCDDTLLLSELATHVG
jgi:hypothetical protein